jgi:hypothetical protein
MELYVLFILLLVFFALFTVSILLFRLFSSGRTQNVIFWTIGCVILILLYFVVGGIITTSFKNLLYYVQPNSDMKHWDTVWYVLAFIGALLFIALIVKSIKNNHIRIWLLMLNIAWIIIICIYTIIYVIYKFKNQITLITVITLGIVSLFLMIFVVNEWFFKIQLWSIFYILFGLACVAFIVAFVIFIISISETIRKFFSQ